MATLAATDMDTYLLHIQRDPLATYQPYQGWDHLYTSRHAAEQAKQRALDAGHHAVRVVRVESHSVPSWW